MGETKGAVPTAGPAVTAAGGEILGRRCVSCVTRTYGRHHEGRHTTSKIYGISLSYRPVSSAARSTGRHFESTNDLTMAWRAGPGRRPIRAPEMRYKEFFICALTDPVVALCFSLSRFSAPVARRGAKTGSRCKTGAAPATVSGERRSIRVTGPARDREGQTAASIREPGDLPRQIRPPAGCTVRPHAWLRPTLALRAHSPVRTRLPGALPLARCLKK